MAGGLAALFDDIAALAKLAAASLDDVGAAAGKASAKAAAVVVDDAAVTPKYVQGFKPERELPVIFKIAQGSLLNKAIITVLALLLSQFLPWLLTPLLMIGGTYLVFEGAEKLWEWISNHQEAEETTFIQGEDQEKQMISGAIRTDFILSAEIMVISLKEVATEPLLTRTLVLIIVALAITALVYGVVGIIVKLDDIGLALAKKKRPGSQRLGQYLVKAMPAILRLLSVIGTLAMLWVGGHIILVGIHDLGFRPPYEFIHHLSHQIAQAAPVLSSFLGWLAETLCSMVIGLVAGAIVVFLSHLFSGGKEKALTSHTGSESSNGSSDEH